MKKQHNNGILVNGSLRKAGITLYTKEGRSIVRVATSDQPRRNTLGQFQSRQRMRHMVALWQAVGPYALFPSGERSRYAQFATLAAGLEVVYLPQGGWEKYRSVLMPGIPVSLGSLPEVGVEIGEVDGTPALLTDLSAARLAEGDRLWLIALRQSIEGCLSIVRASRREVDVADAVWVDGRMALVGDEYGDTMAGWALVHQRRASVSTQRVCTRSTYYRQFTTDEALLAAAAAYGGLTKM